MKHTSRLNLLFETAAWGAGSVLLTAYVAAQWNFSRSREAGLEAFRLAQHSVAEYAHGRIRRTDEAMQVLQEISPPTPPTKPGRSLHVAAPDMTTWSAGRIAAYQDYAGSAVPEAVLRVGAIDLEVPVYAGVTEQNLNRGAAWIEGTAPLGSSGNAGLASHRDGYFRELRNIQLGDVIELQTSSVTQRYVVDDLSIVPPHAVEVLAPTSDQQLTLVTCYPFYGVGPAPKRFIVRARAAHAR